jgi:thioredoxin-like negative regulator of GroEL
MKNVCAFCGRGVGDVKELFTGPPMHICNECIEDYNARLHKGEEESAIKFREEIDHAVSESFKHMVANLDLGELHDKYQLLMKVKFKEGPDAPKFQEVFDEFKRGVAQVIAKDDYQSRYDLGIAYHEMGLNQDAFRELTESLRYATMHRDWKKGEEILSVILFMNFEPKKVFDMLSGVFKEGSR